VRFAPALLCDYDYARLAIGSDDPDELVVGLVLNGPAGASY
jgi:hypothetical protein